MHRLVLLFVACTLAVMSVNALAATANPPHVQKSGVMLSGKVSVDGKTFVADDDNQWTIVNIEALKGYERRYVTLKCRMEPEKRAIRVLLVLEPAKRHPANLGDQAFRR